MHLLSHSVDPSVHFKDSTKVQGCVMSLVLTWVHQYEQISQRCLPNLSALIALAKPLLGIQIKNIVISGLYSSAWSWSTKRNRESKISEIKILKIQPCRNRMTIRMTIDAKGTRMASCRAHPTSTDFAWPRCVCQDIEGKVAMCGTVERGA